VTLLALDRGEAPPLDQVGGKARGLAQLVALGLPVPPAVVLTTDAHAHWRDAGAIDDEDRAALAVALEQLGEPLAVRSSAVDEDAGDRSAAGQYESVIGVAGLADLVAAVEHCWRAADGERAIAYRGGEAARVALVVQRAVPSDRAGVAFSADPLTGDRSAVLVEAVFGYGEGAVAGTITPDRYTVTRDGGAVRARVADKAALAEADGTLTPLPPERRLARTLRDDEAAAVADLTLAAERGQGRPVDVEFCFSGPELWAVQCRPITTLAAND
jgi:phosphoenolpyruvate synthase/pyruvate phosphate dikinase